MPTAALLTTTHSILAFDGHDRFFRVHSGNGLYYGLAQDAENIYVSCRNETTGPVDLAARAGEAGSILVLDPRSLLPTAELRPEEFPLRDVHGIACIDNKLWVTCSFDNLVAVFDLTSRRWSKWYPSADLTARDRDVNHFNTIVSDGRHLCVLAHNNGPSQVLFFDRSSLELCSVQELGRQAHDIFPVDGGLGTCSSGDGVLAANTGWLVRTGAFPRGISQTVDGVLVGLSQLAHRSVRHEMSGILRRFTSDWHYAADYVLPGVGMILSVLPVELDARAFAVLDPFEAQCFRDRYNPVEPGNIWCAGCSSERTVFAPEWHAAEQTHRWTAARDSRMMVVVNPGETVLDVSCSSSFPGPFWTEVFLNGQRLGILRWSEPGAISSQLALPAGAKGKCELLFSVPHLWQPSVSPGVGDERSLGVSIQQLKIS